MDQRAETKIYEMLQGINKRVDGIYRRLDAIDSMHEEQLHIKGELIAVRETLRKFDEMVSAIQDSPLAGMFQ